MLCFPCRKALTRYQMLFRHLFYCKHVERRLCGVWLSNKAAKQHSPHSAQGYVCARPLVRLGHTHGCAGPSPTTGDAGSAPQVARRSDSPWRTSGGSQACVHGATAMADPRVRCSTPHAGPMSEPLGPLGLPGHL